MSYAPLPIWQDVKKANKSSLMPKGYKANNNIFRGAIFIIVVWLLIAGYTLPAKNYWVSCPVNSGGPFNNPLPCDNPFYMVNCDRLFISDMDFCFKETLMPGESFGSRPGFFYTYAGWFSFFVMLGAVLLNHFLYNKKYWGKKL